MKLGERSITLWRLDHFGGCHPPSQPRRLAPLWLCDIAAMLEDLPQDFIGAGAWGRTCIAHWINSVIRAYRLWACADRDTARRSSSTATKWFYRTVLNGGRLQLLLGTAVRARFAGARGWVDPSW
jgi:hypothetical protein